MDTTRFQEFMNDQIEEIHTVKKETEEKTGRDLGDGFVHDWINEKSEIFRKQWEKDHS